MAYFVRSHFFILVLTLSYVNQSYAATKKGLQFDVTSTGQCGAALEGDTGLITYSGSSGSGVEPDELCIWTVHLLTTSTIRLNITDVDFNGGDESCRDGSLRTYSLTNLVQGDNMESYTICPENQGSERIFFLSDDAMVVTFRTSNATGSQGGQGFSLSWEGIKYASPQISHASSISTLQDGLIRYPIRGEYNPNTLSTWLISLNRQTSTFPDIYVDLLALDIETCSPGVPDLNCYCDAVVIYEISWDGKLSEMRRFCGNLAFPVELKPSNKNFLVAFFSDSVNIPGGGGSGFELVWSTSELPTEPTTVPTGPTTPKPDVISTTCNGVLDIKKGESGRISYSNVQDTANEYEVCTWTIRADGSPNITLEVDNYDSSSTEEGNYHDLDVHSLLPVSSSSLIQQRIDSSSGLITLPGPVVVVTFQSNKDRPVGSTASFQLSIKRVESADGEDPGYPVNSVYVDQIFETTAGSIKYPEIPPYETNVLATFIVNPTESSEASYIVFKFDFVSNESFDPIDVFVLIDGVFVHQNRVTADDRVTEYLASNVILLRFSTDRSNSGDGFEASWFTKFPGPTTTCGGIIDLSRDVGKIEYSESATDRTNEQCVWTLRGTSSRTITFQLEEYSLSADKCQTNGLYVAGFTGNYSIGDPLRTEMKILGDCSSSRSVENEEVTIQGPVAFLVFVRTPGNLKVNIHYEPNLDEIEFPYLSNYTDKIGTEENGTLRYPGPAGWPRFNPYEWGTFVVNPLDRNTTSRIALKFTSLDLGQAASCWSANVMTYDLRDGLVFQYMLCGGQTNMEVVGDRTIIVLLRTGEPWSLYANTVRFNWWPRDQ